MSETESLSSCYCDGCVDINSSYCRETCVIRHDIPYAFALPPDMGPARSGTDKESECRRV